MSLLSYQATEQVKTS